MPITDPFGDDSDESVDGFITLFSKKSGSTPSKHMMAEDPSTTSDGIEIQIVSKDDSDDVEPQPHNMNTASAITAGKSLTNSRLFMFVAILALLSWRVSVHQRAEIAAMKQELKELKELLNYDNYSKNSSSNSRKRSLTARDGVESESVITPYHGYTYRSDYSSSEEMHPAENEKTITTTTTTTTTQETTTRYLTVKGVVGDGIADDTSAIQRAINRASSNKINAKLVLPKGVFLITSTIKIPAGITLMGQGYGSSPLAIQFDAGGSTLAYCGNSFAVSIRGHAVSLENLAITDWRGTEECINTEGKGGIIIQAKSKLVESISLRNLLIYQFMSGTSIKMIALNKGGIAFSSFENIRVRHAKIGVHIIAADEESFVNSNSFHDGAITGGITEVAVKVEGPGACNDNQFNGVAIEPPSTSLAHVYVSGSRTNIKLNRVRLEGTEMPLDKPMIIIEDDSYGNVMNGILGHTFLQGDLNRNPEITFRTNKMVGIKPAEHNLFWNAAFRGLDLTGTYMPGWSFTGGDGMVAQIPSSEQELLFPDHNILQVTYLDENSAFKFSPSSLPRSPIHSFCSFGIYAQSNVPGSISAVMKYASGSTITSASHTGSGKWEFIGMSSLYDKVGGPRAYFSITGDVNVTAPTFVYGSAMATPGAELMSSSGARMSGVFTSSVIAVSPPETDKWNLPVEGNIYDVLPFPNSGGEDCGTTYHSVRRINDSNPRFVKGTVITIMFPACGDCVPCLALRDNAYINLMGELDFAPDPVGTSSITLVSIGFGVWKEVSRNGLM